MIWHGIAHSPELQSDFYIGTLLLINMRSQAYLLALDFVYYHTIGIKKIAYHPLSR